MGVTVPDYQGMRPIWQVETPIRT